LAYLLACLLGISHYHTSACSLANHCWCCCYFCTIKVIISFAHYLAPIHFIVRPCSSKPDTSRTHTYMVYPRASVRVRAQTNNLLWTNPILMASKPSFSFPSSPSQPVYYSVQSMNIHATQVKLTGLSTASLCLGNRLASSPPLYLLVLTLVWLSIVRCFQGHAWSVWSGIARLY